MGISDPSSPKIFRGLLWVAPLDEILGLISSPESCGEGGVVKGHEAKSRRQEL